MKPAQLLLAYQRLVDRERALREQLEAIERRLASDPEVTRLEGELGDARSRQQAAAARLRESDHEREAHRSRLRTRERELMSGRVRNPTELMQMSEEVAHMKASFAQEEEAELALMEESELADEVVRTLTSQLEGAAKSAAAEAPNLERELDGLRTQLGDVESERDSTWAEISPRDQAVFRRVRVHPAVAEVVGNQCQACHVTVTSSGMQVLRKGDELVDCDNCGRVLVMA